MFSKHFVKGTPDGAFVRASNHYCFAYNESKRQDKDTSKFKSTFAIAPQEAPSPPADAPMPDPIPTHFEKPRAGSRGRKVLPPKPPKPQKTTPPLILNKQFKGYKFAYNLALGASKNAKIYANTHLVYASVQGRLAIYCLKHLEECLVEMKLGKKVKPGHRLIKFDSVIQGFDFFKNIFSKDRIVVLTASGEISKLVFNPDPSKLTMVKRKIVLQEAFNSSVIFTDLATCGNFVFVSGFNHKQGDNMIIVLNRSLKKKAKVVLPTQLSHIHKLVPIKLKRDILIMCLCYEKVVSLIGFKKGVLEVLVDSLSTGHKYNFGGFWKSKKEFVVYGQQDTDGSVRKGAFGALKINDQVFEYNY